LKGLIFDLQRYSIHDGPGIRTVVFLKGCPLNCLWCCNPESQAPDPELEFRYSLCRKCGRCIAACPENAIHADVNIEPSAKIDRNKCTLCAACVQVCPNNALRITGEWAESDDILEQCLKDSDTYRRSGGGVTLSGGEPLFQPAFSLELLEKLYNRNIHTAIETTGYASWDTLESFLPWTDLFLFDIKHMNPVKHLEFTGVSNRSILENLERLINHKANVILRFPIIPGLNDDNETIEALGSLAIRHSINEVHLMPFHQLGKEKYRRIGRNYALDSMPAYFENADQEYKLQTIQNAFQRKGIRTQIGG
jgi:pyruvate formate lyase activating enzyme